MPRSPAVAALRAAYPSELPDDGAAVAWTLARRAALTARVAGDDDAALAASSECAASGAARHRTALTGQAVVALHRLDEGSLTVCLRCAQLLAFDRLDAAAGVVSCADC